MNENLISSYSREEAIADGVLIDISNTKEAREAGFLIPICITSALHEMIKVPEGLEGSQNYEGRLWDVCFMAALAFKKKIKEGIEEELTSFKIYFQTGRKRITPFELWLIFNSTEGFTIMFPEDY